MSEITVDLGDIWGPCDVKFTVVQGDPHWGEPDFYEYDVYYAGDEDGSRQGEEISASLTDAEHNKIVREIKDYLVWERRWGE